MINVGALVFGLAMLGVAVGFTVITARPALRETIRFRGAPPGAAVSVPFLACWTAVFYWIAVPLLAWSVLPRLRSAEFTKAWGLGLVILVVLLFVLGFVEMHRAHRAAEAALVPEEFREAWRRGEVRQRRGVVLRVEERFDPTTGRMVDVAVLEPLGRRRLAHRAICVLAYLAAATAVWSSVPREALEAAGGKHPVGIAASLSVLVLLALVGGSLLAPGLRPSRLLLLGAAASAVA